MNALCSVYMEPRLVSGRLLRRAKPLGVVRGYSKCLSSCNGVNNRILGVLWLGWVVWVSGSEVHVWVLYLPFTKPNIVLNCTLCTLCSLIFSEVPIREVLKNRALFKACSLRERCPFCISDADLAASAKSSYPECSP